MLNFKFSFFPALFILCFWAQTHAERTPQVFYYQSDGRLVSLGMGDDFTNGSKTPITSWKINGPEALSTLPQPGGAGNWTQSYDGEAEVWVDASGVGAEGRFVLATYEPGLDESDFGSAEYSFSSGTQGSTHISIIRRGIVIDEDWADGAFDDPEGWTMVSSPDISFRETGRSEPAMALTRRLGTNFLWPVAYFHTTPFAAGPEDVLLIKMRTFSDVAFNDAEAAKPEVACLHDNPDHQFNHDNAAEISRHYYTRGDGFAQIRPSVDNVDVSLNGLHHAGGSTPATLENAETSMGIFRPVGVSTEVETFGERSSTTTLIAREMKEDDFIQISMPNRYRSNKSPVHRSGTNSNNSYIGMSSAHVGVTSRTDVNLDYRTDALDFIYISSYFGDTSSHLQTGDVNNDEVTNTQDLELWAASFGETYDSVQQASASGISLNDLPGTGTPPQLIYNRQTGVLTLIPTTAVSAFIINGPDPQDVQLELPNDGEWLFAEVGGELQWVDLSRVGMSSRVNLAQYETGLSATDFSNAEFGYADGGHVEVAVQIVDNGGSSDPGVVLYNGTTFSGAGPHMFDGSLFTANGTLVSTVDSAVFEFDGNLTTSGPFGTTKYRMELNEGSIWTFGPNARANNNQNDITNARQILFVGDESDQTNLFSNSVVFDEAFDVDLASVGTNSIQRNGGLSTMTLSYVNMITNHSRNLPTIHKLASRNLRTFENTHHGLVTINDPSEWRVQTNPQEYDGGIYWKSDWTLNTEEELRFTGIFHELVNIGFGTHAGTQDTTFTKLGPGDLVIDGTQYYAANTRIRIREGRIIFNSNPKNSPDSGNGFSSGAGNHLNMLIEDGATAVFNIPRNGRTILGSVPGIDDSLVQGNPSLYFPFGQIPEEQVPSVFGVESVDLSGGTLSIKGGGRLEVANDLNADSEGMVTFYLSNDDFGSGAPKIDVSGSVAMGQSTIRIVAENILPTGQYQLIHGSSSGQIPALELPTGYSGDLSLSTGSPDRLILNVSDYSSPEPFAPITDIGFDSSEIVIQLTSTEAGRDYTLRHTSEISTPINQWSVIGAPQTGDGGMLEYRVPLGDFSGQEDGFFIIEEEN